MKSWKEGAVARRDARHTSVPDAPRTRSIPNRRDTKRWCKGKIGVEHVLAIKSYRDLKGDDSPQVFSGWLVRYCSVCGKETDLYMPPWPSTRKQKPAPGWVTEFFAEAAK